MPDWPGPIRILRGQLPAEMRILRGAGGLLAGGVVVFEVLVVLLGGNWQLGYTHDWLLTTIFGLLIPAGVGILSPLWLWVGRPLWVRFDRSGQQRLPEWRGATFLPGLVGPLAGASLFFLVSATSRFWVQTLIPFGLLLGIVSPLWYWVVRPIAGDRLARVVPMPSDVPSPAVPAVRILPAIGVLFVIGMAVTAVIALPVAAVGEPVASDGLSVSITETQTVTEVTDLEGQSVAATHDWRLLLVRLEVHNVADGPRAVPGQSVGDIAVIAPECGANNFGEPANNCNQAYLDGDFRADGEEYANYDARQEAVGGTISSGERITGWLVFRIERSPTQTPSFDVMVIVDDVGRWTLPAGWRS